MSTTTGRAPTRLCAAAALLAVGCGGPTDPTGVPSARPNILLILADDLDAGSAALMPRLKSLVADRGLTFRNSFASTPVCCPSRASILTGQYTHNHGILDNFDASGSCFEQFRDAGQERSTLATWLQDAGYRTGMIGKYLNRYPGDRRGANPRYVPPGWDEWYAIIGVDAYYDYFLNHNGRLARYFDVPEHYQTDVLADLAVDFVAREGASPARPFFLWLAPIAPHLPAIPAPRHENAFPDARAPRTPSFNELDMSDKPLWFQDPRQLPLLTEDDIARLDATYRERLRSLLAVDEMVERLVAALEATGQLANTYVVFTSDNGFHLGHHRFNRGKGTVYEPSVRIPLVVRGPGVPEGRVRPHPVLNVDLPQTFGQLAGARLPGSVDGRSFVSLLGEEARGGWRTEVLLENPLTPRPPDEFQGWWAFQTDGLAYAEYRSGERELYDLRDDPDQTESLHGRADPALLEALSRRLAQLRNCRGASCP
jgi:arylsulfatase A-like enzyme